MFKELILCLTTGSTVCRVRVEGNKWPTDQSMQITVVTNVSQGISLRMSLDPNSDTADLTKNLKV